MHGGRGILYYDDIEVGYRYGIRAPAEPRRGIHEVTAEQIVAFAELWDPRPQHTDPEAARSSTFGGPVASGAHAFALWTRLALEAARQTEPIAILAGLESNFRLRAPIRPGDVLGLRVEVVEKRPSESRPDAGILVARHELTNQDDRIVVENRAVSLVQRR